MYTIEQLQADPDLLQRLIDEHQTLKYTIECSPLQFCVYDKDDRIIAWNAAYEELHQRAFNENRQKAADRELTYAEIVRYQLAGEMPDEEVEEEVTQRVRQQREADGSPVVRPYRSGEYLRIIKYPLPTGAVAGIALNITDLINREQELAEAKLIAEAAEKRSMEALRAEKMLQRATQLLSELDEWLQCCQSLDELFPVVSAYMSKLLPGTEGELYIYSHSRDMLDGACHWNSEGILGHIAPDSCWALRRGRPYHLGVGGIKFTCAHVDAQNHSTENLRYLCLPIVAQGETVGLLHIRFKEDGENGRDREAMPRRMSDLHQFAAQCAEHISLAIANVKLRDELRDQSIRDPLTGLYNRRYFMDRLRSELRKADKRHESFSLISFDADKFKSFNDNHGHDAGDLVLREIGETTHSMFNGSAVACRFGGEEFNVLLPSTDVQTAADAAEKLRANVESLVIRYANADLPRVTISAGVAAFPDHGRQPQDLLKAADEALYMAKDQGRNRVCVGFAR